MHDDPIVKIPPTINTNHKIAGSDNALSSNRVRLHVVNALNSVIA
jgi:hypothetical protein